MTWILTVGFAIPLYTTGCAEAPLELAGDAEVASLLSISPQGGAADVDPNTAVILEFSHAMHGDIYAALHERDASGPVVGGRREWSEDQTRLIFTPASPLKSQTPYTIHLGGGMMDANGNVIDLERYGHDTGGQWVTEHMMGGGMMDGTHMGLGWPHANWTYGMFFTFTTQ
jgi:hypothetical protein